MMLADNCTYAATSFNGSFKFTVDDMKKTMREMEWLSYEVDPEWSKFCSFGPDDIGSVWEKIGAIRKRPKFDTLIVSESMKERLNRLMKGSVLSHGIQVVSSAYLGDEKIMAFNTANPPEEIKFIMEERRERVFANFGRDIRW